MKTSIVQHYVLFLHASVVTYHAVKLYNMSYMLYMSYILRQCKVVYGNASGLHAIPHFALVYADSACMCAAYTVQSQPVSHIACCVRGEMRGLPSRTACQINHVVFTCLTGTAASQGKAYQLT